MPLSLRALNRATLGRQLLLERARLPTLDAIHHLVVLQAQLARPPFQALWSRLEGFRREDLQKLIADRSVVRSPFLRGTLHLTTAEDLLLFRTAVQAALSEAQKVLRDRGVGLDPEALTAAGRTFFQTEAQDMEAFRASLEASHPGGDHRAMAYLVRTLLPLVQVPDGSAWGYPSASAFLLAEAWLGRAHDPTSRQSELVERYLRAHGPATRKDCESWSGIKKLAPAFEALRPKLVETKDEDGRTLYDLLDAPETDEDAQPPVRFLPEFDSILLAFADRRRVIDDAHRPAVITKNLRVLPTFLVDGRIAGTWSSKATKKKATLTLAPFAPLPKRVLPELEAEGEGLLRFSETLVPTFELRIEG